jgi:hypothetical protein
MQKSRGFCGRLLGRPHQPGTRFVKGQPNGVRPSTSAPYHSHHVGKRARNRGGTVPGNRQGIRRYPHAIAPTRSRRPQKQAGNRRVPRPSLRPGEAALHGVYVLPCASSVVRLAGTLRPGRTRMVVSSLANLTRGPARGGSRRRNASRRPVSDATLLDPSAADVLLGTRPMIRLRLSRRLTVATARAHRRHVHATAWSQRNRPRF